MKISIAVPLLIASAILLYSFDSAVSAGRSDDDWLPDLWTGAIEVDGRRRAISIWVAESEDRLVIAFEVDGEKRLGAWTDQVEATDNSVSFAFTNDAGDWRFTGRLEDGRIEGAFAHAGKNIPTTLFRQTLAKRRRPQAPKPPFPYSVEEIHVEAAQGVAIDGVVTRPAGDGPFPSVLLVSNLGAGADNAFAIDHRPFTVLADYLARRGVLTLRYAGRGSWDERAWWIGPDRAALAADAGQLVRYLASRSDVATIGVIGTGEGATIAAVCAASTPTVRRLSLLSARAVTGMDTYLQGARLSSLARGLSAHQAELRVDSTRQMMTGILNGANDVELRALLIQSLLNDRRTPPEMLEAAAEAQLLRLRDPWRRFYLTDDPMLVLQQVQIPVLAIYGANDTRLDPEVNAAVIREATQGKATVRVLPHLNHSLQPATTLSNPDEIEVTIDPAVLGLLGDWFAAPESESAPR